MLTKAWEEIAATYQDYAGDRRSIQALAGLAERINGSPLARGLFAWTSMFDLCIVQTEVSEYPYNGPLLRIAPASADQLEFTYEDTMVRPRGRYGAALSGVFTHPRSRAGASGLATAVRRERSGIGARSRRVRGVRPLASFK